MNQISSSETQTKELASSGKSLKQWAQELLARGAQEWNISQRTMLLILAVPFFVIVCGVVAGLLGKPAYKMFTGEDKIAETWQVILWVITLILCVKIARNRLGKQDFKVIGLMYALLAIGIFFIIGEEVSWGQRVFGWSTPDSMKVMNKQDETNVHNIHGIGETFKWMHLVVGAYGTFVPIIFMRTRRFARYRKQLALLIPHFTLIPFFATALMWRIYRNFFDEPEGYYFAVSEFSEVIEVVLGFGFMFFMLQQYRRIRMQEALLESSDNNHR